MFTYMMRVHCLCPNLVTGLQRRQCIWQTSKFEGLHALFVEVVGHEDLFNPIGIRLQQKIFFPLPNQFLQLKDATNHEVRDFPYNKNVKGRFAELSAAKGLILPGFSHNQDRALSVRGPPQKRDFEWAHRNDDNVGPKNALETPPGLCVCN